MQTYNFQLMVSGKLDMPDGTSETEAVQIVSNEAIGAVQNIKANALNVGIDTITSGVKLMTAESLQAGYQQAVAPSRR